MSSVSREEYIQELNQYAREAGFKLQPVRRTNWFAHLVGFGLFLAAVLFAVPLIGPRILATYRESATLTVQTLPTAAAPAATRVRSNGGGGGSRGAGVVLPQATPEPQSEPTPEPQPTEQPATDWQQIADNTDHAAGGGVNPQPDYNPAVPLPTVVPNQVVLPYDPKNPVAAETMKRALENSGASEQAAALEATQTAYDAVACAADPENPCQP